jgi:hypothetical protein
VNNQDAWFCFRNGDNCVAYGNFFIGAGGIRLKEANNIYCYNNYFENAGVGGNADAVTLVYYTVNTTNVLNNINFIHNTFVNCGNIDMGGVGATSNTWANNIFKKTSGSIFSNANSGTTYAGNIYSGSLGISIPTGMTSTDPKLVKNAIGYYAPSATSPVIDAASASYPAILDIASIDDDPSLLLDISGITRSASAILKDVGCSEYSTGTTTNHPLVLSEVGPSFLIIKANQTITFSAIASKQTGIDDFDPGALASSSLSVSYASSNSLVATIVNGKIHIVGAGNSTITASQIGNTSFNAATNVNQNLTVIQAPKINQTITFNVLPQKTTIDADFDAGATASSSLVPSYSSSNTSVATIVNGLIHIVGSGMTTITASQSGNLSYNAATDVSQTLSVSDVSSTSITLNPIADSYIFGGATTTNNGTLADLYLKKGSGTTGDRIIYLQFDISGQNIYTISSAKVRLYANSVPSAYTITVSQTTDNWTETGITYASCPAKGTDLSSVSVTAAGAYYEWDVSSYIQSQFNSNDNIISLVFNDLSASGVIDKFNSKEATANTPQLYVTLNKMVTTDPVINDNNFRMFINAGSTLATFDYFLEKECEVSAQMYALNGQQIKSIINNENQHAGKNQKTLDISELKSGIYIIRFKANNKSKTIKFLIVK